MDLGVDGTYIRGPILVHHINPLTPEDFNPWNMDKLLNPNNLITCSIETHNKIHYGDRIEDLSSERSPDDTKLW